MLIDIFERIGHFFARLETYTEVPLTPEMTYNMAQITVEILDILATGTKQMKKSGTSKSGLRFRFHDADMILEKFLKRAMGQTDPWTDLEDEVKKLDKLTIEGAMMANAWLLKITDSTYHEGKGINENSTEINEKMQRMIGKQRLFSE